MSVWIAVPLAKTHPPSARPLWPTYMDHHRPYPYLHLLLVLHVYEQPNAPELHGWPVAMQVGALVVGVFVGILVVGALVGKLVVGDSVVGLSVGLGVVGT